MVQSITGSTKPRCDRQQTLLVRPISSRRDSGAQRRGSRSVQPGSHDAKDFGRGSIESRTPPPSSRAEVQMLSEKSSLPSGRIRRNCRMRSDMHAAVASFTESVPRDQPRQTLSLKFVGFNRRPRTMSSCSDQLEVYSMKIDPFTTPPGLGPKRSFSPSGEPVVRRCGRRRQTAGDRWTHECLPDCVECRRRIQSDHDDAVAIKSEGRS